MEIFLDELPEGQEVSFRNWCLENSMKINEGKSAEKIIEDAEKFYKFIRPEDKPKANINNIHRIK